MTYTAKATQILAEFGVEMAPGGFPVMADIRKAETCYIHHSRMPVALTAFALISPSFAKGRFPTNKLVDVVCKRWQMDPAEVVTLTTLCGQPVDGDFWTDNQVQRELFIAHLEDIVARYELYALYAHGRPAQGITLKPRGADLDDESEETKQQFARTVTEWRKAYSGLPAHKQLLSASLMWLYRGDPDKTWLSRVGAHTWHAADAIPEMRAAGILEDWAKLIALYPGW